MAKKKVRSTELVPYDRIERWLDTILNNKADPWEPQTRLEIWLSEIKKAVNNQVVSASLVPETPMECWFQAIIDGTASVPEIKRNRLELWMGAFLSMNEAPPAPYTKIELWFLQMLNLIQYEEFSGTEIEFNARGQIVKELIVDIVPYQSGTGEPSPENVRPILGWNGVVVKRFGTDETDHLLTLDIPFVDAGVVYGGTLNVTTGILMVDRAVINIDTFINEVRGVTRYQPNFNEINGFMGLRISSGRLARLGLSTSNDRSALCSHFKWYVNNWNRVDELPSLGYVDGLHFTAHYTDLGLEEWTSSEEFTNTEQEAMRSALSSMIIVWYPAAPHAYQLTPQELRTILGTNHINAYTYNGELLIPANMKLKIQK